MSQLDTVVRSLDDVGLAAWFGGSLMGRWGSTRRLRPFAIPENGFRWPRWA